MRGRSRTATAGPCSSSVSSSKSERVSVWLGGGKITLIHSCMSYEEEDTCKSYEEEDTRRRQDALIHSCPPFYTVPRPPFTNPPAHSRMGRKG
jgi:hypothetical protein